MHVYNICKCCIQWYCVMHVYNICNYYIRLYFTVFLLARSNTRDIPFSSILISKKQFLCHKKPYCTLVQNQWMKLRATREQNVFFIAQKLLFAHQYVRKLKNFINFLNFQKISKFQKFLKTSKIKNVHKISNLSKIS